jgi:hypothetical protein
LEQCLNNFLVAFNRIIDLKFLERFILTVAR